MISENKCCTVEPESGIEVKARIKPAEGNKSPPSTIHMVQMWRFWSST